MIVVTRTRSPKNHSGISQVLDGHPGPPKSGLGSGYSWAVSASLGGPTRDDCDRRPAGEPRVEEKPLPILRDGVYPTCGECGQPSQEDTGRKQGLRGSSRELSRRIDRHHHERSVRREVKQLPAIGPPDGLATPVL